MRRPGVTTSSDSRPEPSPSPPAATPGPARPSRLRYTFGANQRLKGKTAFDHLFHHGLKRTAFPLVAFGERRADNGPSRIGISIGRKCGNAVVRNLIKRRLREAYRLLQHEWPVGTDWMLVIRPHPPLAVAEYQAKLRHLLPATVGPPRTDTPVKKSPPTRGRKR